jgi:hypothetical protein
MAGALYIHGLRMIIQALLGTLQHPLNRPIETRR